MAWFTYVGRRLDPFVFRWAYYPRLASAKESALQKVKLRLGGKALRWEALDEDIWIGHAVTGRYPKGHASSGGCVRTAISRIWH